MSPLKNIAYGAHKQRGLTMIELMIAITLSLVLIAGIFQIFSSSKQSYRVQDNLGRLQENARFAMDLLTHDIRMAGNIGCNKNANINNSIAGLTPIGSGIQGFELLNKTILSTNMLNANDVISSSAIEDTDAILIKGAAGNGSDLVQISTAANVVANFNAAEGLFDVGDIAVIADCDDADIFQITNVSEVSAVGVTLSHNNSLSKTYGLDAQVMPLAYSIYYIAEDSNDVSNLYRRSIGGNSTGDTIVLTAEALIENVQDMQILYGQDTSGNGSAIRYVDAADPILLANMDQITSVRINLLLATAEGNLAEEPQTYWFADTEREATDNDRRLFRSVSTTISMRN